MRVRATLGRGWARSPGEIRARVRRSADLGERPRPATPWGMSAAAAPGTCARTAAARLLIVVDGVVLTIVDGFLADIDVFLAGR
jgi:hypothetical protein